jgi:hypothetical protein
MSKLKFFSERYRKPTIGYSLQMEHFASCLAVSAAASLCNTGSQTIDCGSSLSQSRKLLKSIETVLFAFSRQHNSILIQV